MQFLGANVVDLCVFVIPYSSNVHDFTRNIFPNAGGQLGWALGALARVKTELAPPSPGPRHRLLLGYILLENCSKEEKTYRGFLSARAVSNDHNCGREIFEHFVIRGVSHPRVV